MTTFQSDYFMIRKDWSGDQLLSQVDCFACLVAF